MSGVDPEGGAVLGVYATKETPKGPFLAAVSSRG